MRRARQRPPGPSARTHVRPLLSQTKSQDRKLLLGPFCTSARSRLCRARPVEDECLSPAPTAEEPRQKAGAGPLLHTHFQELEEGGRAAGFPAAQTSSGPGKTHRSQRPPVLSSASRWSRLLKRRNYRGLT
ncbi:uncharacterized protein LOC115618250 isoform X3 [Strigops habroptila]|uniref:uncharacterized protein LOC115618250 isoform X3 n=1 Tax=Strigops habroptila TaxID=2489341 RepID=UPI0011CFEEEE|nr:uncharacterized protein LOC115618250 isoform X3 [Strigops habroptila]